jgi:hypothetical protein
MLERKEVTAADVVSRVNLILSGLDLLFSFSYSSQNLFLASPSRRAAENPSLSLITDLNKFFCRFYLGRLKLSAGRGDKENCFHHSLAANTSDYEYQNRRKEEEKNFKGSQAGAGKLKICLSLCLVVGRGARLGNVNSLIMLFADSTDIRACIRGREMSSLVLLCFHY